MLETEQQEATPRDLGKLAGLSALSPLVELSKVFGDSVNQDDRKNFLAGYLEGVSEFFKGRGLVVPISSNLDIILQRDGLAGFIKGLNREKPSPQGRLVPPSGEYKDPAGEGYFLGFMTGLANDYNLNLLGTEVPRNEEQFELFSRGLNTRPRVYTSLSGVNFVSEGDRQITIQLENWVYEAGLKLWLNQRGLDVNLANKISHPEALEAFELALEGGTLETEPAKNSPQEVGFRLGQAAREQFLT